MIACPVLDPRLAAAPRDNRVGRPMLKALRKGPAFMASPPTAKQVESERPFWGKHPDKGISAIEEEFYAFGSKFLRNLYGAVIGQTKPKAFQKALGASGWGDIARLWEDPAMTPDARVNGWTSVIDRLVTGLWKDSDARGQAQAFAMRTHLLKALAKKAASGDLAPRWGDVSADQNNAQRESMAWTRARAGEHLQNLRSSSVEAIRVVMIDSKQAGEGVGKVQQRLYQKFSGLQKDWRRIALSESAMAVTNGQVASVDPAEGWLAHWTTAANACPYCKRMDGRRFRIVPADAPNKDGETQIWVGKNNIGRSAHRYSKKEGRFRDSHEMWWPCIPLHCNCACSFTLIKNKPQK